MSRLGDVRKVGEDVPMSSRPSGSGMLEKMMVVLKVSIWL